MTADRKDAVYLAEHVTGFDVDAAHILDAFGIGPGQGVHSLKLEVESDKFVKLTVARYITGRELEALYVALNAESKPSNPHLLSVKNELSRFHNPTKEPK